MDLLPTYFPSFTFMTTPTVACAFAIGCIILQYIGSRYLGNAKPVFPLPPGPPGLPWIGNVTGIDTNAPWLTYREWAKTYGDIIHTRLLGKNIVILNSEKTAKELLDNRSWNNSDRPYFITNELCGLAFNSALLPYGDRWRLHRRFSHQTLRADAVERFVPFQHRKTCQLLRELLKAPERLDEHVFQHTSSVILNGAYDYDPVHGDELINTVAKVQEVAISVVRPDIAIMVATFPIVLKLPGWFPGMSFKKEMVLASKLVRQYVEIAFKHSLDRVRECSFAPSMVHDGMRNMEERTTVPNELWMKALKEAAATAFLAGSETSHSILMSCFLMMALNPEAQERAQAQIDAVVGNERLPTMDDRPSLPYIDAIFRETLRYNPIIPLGVPHAAVYDDVYRGFHIPKGSIFLVNAWAMAHDEARFPDSHAFKPERFLYDDGSLKPNDIEHIAYGFGRRICVGRHFADLSVWSVIAKVLAVFKIMKPVDEYGVEIPLEPKFTSGLAVRPLPFQCRIVPRMPGMDAKKLEELIAASTA